MAHTLKISHSSDITLTSGDYAVTYVPQMNANKPTVTETALLRIDASSVANMQTDLKNITRAFELAQRRLRTGRGQRVYIKFSLSGDSDTYRSELWSNNPEDILGTVEIMQPTMYSAITDIGVVQVRLEWTRRNYWEDDSESELSLSNGGGSGTGGQSVYNFHTSAVFSDTTVSFTATDTIADSGNGFGIFAIGDVISLRGSTSNDGIYTVTAVDGGGADITVNEPVVNEAAGDSIDIYDMQNYVHIDSSAIAGDLPAACRIEFTNDDAGDDLETVWMSQNYLSEPDDFAHILEAGDGDTGSDDADATSSNSIHRTYAISDTEAKVEGWTIPTETLTAADGGYFKVFARFAAITNITSVKWRIKILYSGTTVWEGGQVQFDDTYALTNRIIREIDTVQLPPFVPENSVPTDLTFELWGVRTGGAINVDIDSLVLMPLDGYRRLRSLDGIAQNSVLIDDGVTGTYYQEVSSEQVRDIAAVGNQIMLWPNTDNRIYFLMHSHTDNTADHNRSGSVQIYYRPRRITL